MLEFNELTPALMERFIAEGHLPGFERLRREAVTCVTDAEEEPPALEPWIQWVTVHTGLAFAEHGVYDLGDGETLRAPRIWDVVADHGGRAWICSSMNAAVQTERPAKVHLIPDPWSVDLRPLPSGAYDLFYDFVRTYVQDYARDRPPLTRIDYARFARFMIVHGLSPRTVIDAVAQLAGERLGAPKWRRAVILDRLLWDVFRFEWKRLQPTLATFFLNSTAHFQHYHWRDMEPERFALGGQEDRRAAEAILLGYKRMDRIVRECIAMAGKQATIVMATALGQQPMTIYDERGGKQIFKPRDATVLLRFAGYEGSFRYSPVMAEQFHLFFNNESDAADAHARLLALCVDGQPLMEARRNGDVIFAGCAIIKSPPKGAEVVTSHKNKSVGFDVLFFPLQGIKSGMHHPDGLLWIRRPHAAPATIERKVSLREIAPTLMTLCGIEPAGRFKCLPLAEVVNARASSLEGTSRRISQ
jgi:hypothetical protein